jgi:hypothetical protein
VPATLGRKICDDCSLDSDNMSIWQLKYAIKMLGEASHPREVGTWLTATPVFRVFGNRFRISPQGDLSEANTGKWVTKRRILARSGAGYHETQKGGNQR